MKHAHPKKGKQGPPPQGPMMKKKKKKAVPKGGVAEEAQQPKRLPSIPYTMDDIILLVGEGNFSFAASLAEELGSAEQMVSTSYDSEEEVKVKYPDAPAHIELIKDLGGTVLHGVDARNLEGTKALRGKKFSKIVFNFPHAGAGIKDQDRNILSNQQLLASFFVSSRPLLSSLHDAVAMSPQGPLKLPDGEVHVTLKTGLPYDEWGVTHLAASAGYSAKVCLLFRPECYPAYEHRRTIGYDATKAGNEEIKDKVCRTWCYVLSSSLGKKRRPPGKAGGKPKGKPGAKVCSLGKKRHKGARTKSDSDSD